MEQMTTSPIQPIGSTQQNESSSLTQILVTQMEMMTQSRLASSQAETPQLEAKAETKPEVKSENSLENISLHFRVDDKTNSVIIFLVDRKSHKVLRSIPATELQKMQIGDLLKLTA